MNNRQDRNVGAMAKEIKDLREKVQTLTTQIGVLSAEFWEQIERINKRLENIDQ